jgi:hypothetical protein
LTSNSQGCAENIHIHIRGTQPRYQHVGKRHRCKRQDYDSGNVIAIFFPNLIGKNEITETESKKVKAQKSIMRPCGTCNPPESKSKEAGIQILKIRGENIPGQIPRHVSYYFNIRYRPHPILYKNEYENTCAKFTERERKEVATRSSNITL